MGSLFYLLTSRGWEGEWQGGVQAASNALIFLLPAVLVGSGLDGRRYFGKGGLRPPSTPGSALALKRVVAIFVGSMAWPVLVVVALIGVALALNSTVSSFRFPGLLPLLLPIVWVGMYVALGLLLSQHVHPIVLVPLSAVLGFVLPVLAASTPDARPNLFTVLDDGAVSVPILLNPATLATQAMIFGGSLGLFVLLVLGRWETPSPSAGRRRSRLAVIGASLLAVVVAAAGTLGPTERRYEAYGVSGPRECGQGEAVEVCVWPDHSPLLQPALRQAPRLDDALGFWTARPSSYIERGLAGDSSSSDFTTGTTFDTDDSLVRAMVVGVVSRLACGGEVVAYTRDVAAREEWLLVRLGSVRQADASAGVRRILQRPAPEQETWWMGLQGLDSECLA